MDEEDLIQRGPKAEIPPIEKSLGEHLLNRVKSHGDRIALVAEVDGEEVTIRFSDVLRNGMIVGKTLQENGVKVGDTVMICCGNIIEFTSILLGTLIVGATGSSYNPAYYQADLLNVLGVIGPKLVICDSECHPIVKQALTEQPDYSAIVVISVADLTERFSARNPACCNEIQPPPIQDLKEHVAMVMNTSGTTGVGKGVEITHYAILYLLTTLKPDPTMIRMTQSEPFWTSGIIPHFQCLHSGEKLILLRPFTEPTFLYSVSKYKVNITSLRVPEVVALAKWSGTENFDLSSLKIVSTHGSRVPSTMLELVEKKLGQPVAQGYGMTELWLSLQPAFGQQDKAASSGTLATNVEAKVVDVKTGKALGPNCEGELCFWSPAMLKGYRGNPEATKALFDEKGFIHTTDIGYYDESGYFYIVDRIVDLIKYKNILVTAIEIEDVLLEHDGILEASVIGIPHDGDTEYSTAFVVKRPTSRVSAEQLLKLVEGKLPETKWLHGGVVFVQSLPRTYTGKIKKRELKTLALASPSKLQTNS